MAITAGAQALIQSAVIAQTIDNIDVISISTSGGEVFRKAPTAAVEVLSTTKRKYTFYLTELEAQVVITKLSLYGGTATTTLGTGTEMCNATVTIDKTGTNKSLLIYWTVEVV